MPSAEGRESNTEGVTGRIRAGRDAVGRTRLRTKRAAKAVVSPSFIRGSAIETAWWATHIAMYPFGVLEERARSEEMRLNLHGLDPVRRGLIIGDVEAAGTPIILVHGVVDNRSIFTLVRRSLRKRGFGRVITLNYSPLTDDVRRVAKRLEDLVEAVCHETNYERVHVVGHSMGGLIARYYVQRMGGDARVHTVVTMGTPHAGSLPASFVPHPVARQMRRDSELIAELHAPAPGCRTRFVAIWSDLDQMIVPQRNAQITHPDLNARNVFVKGVGHLSLPVDGRVVHEICTTLAHLDHDGSTLAPGATSIASSGGRLRIPHQPNRRRQQVAAR